MAEITTNRFGVPLTSAGGEGILMPKLKYRFRVTFLGGFAGNGDSKALTRNVVSVGRPTYTAEEVVIDSYNSKSYVQGKHSWETIELVVRDDITNNVVKDVGAQVQRQLNHFQQTTPASGSSYKFDMQVEVLDGSDTRATEVWFLEGCFFTSVNYGDHDYSTSESQTVSMTIRYDNATHYHGDNDIDGIIQTGQDLFPDSAGILDAASEILG